MARAPSLYLQVSARRFYLHFGDGKKRLILESFSNALQVYFLGASGGCKWQEEWEAIFPHIAKPEDGDREKEIASEWLRENDKKLQCNKLRMDSTACYDCKDNPQGKARRTIDAKSLDLHRENIKKVERLHDIVRMNLTKLEKIGDLEFEMLRLYWWQIEKIMTQSRVRLF